MTDPERLITRWLDDELTEIEQAELTAWLRSDDAHVRRFVDAILFEQQLRSAVVARQQQAAFCFERLDMPDRGGSGRRSSLASRTASSLSGVTWVVGVLGAVLLLAWLVESHQLDWLSRSIARVMNFRDSQSAEPVGQANQPRSPRDALAASSFCQLTGSVSAQWEAGQAWQTGAWLEAGRLNLVAGVAELTFDNGVRVVCTGPTDLELLSPMRVWLHGGQVVVHVPRMAIGFTLETADAAIVDLGTEFGVRVARPNPAASLDATGTAPDSAGESTELQVYEGEVIADVKLGSSARVGSKRLVQGGQAVRIDNQAGVMIKELPFEPERFVYVLPDPKDHPDAVATGLPKTTPYNQPIHNSIKILPALSKIEIDGSLEDWDLSGQFFSACPLPWADNYNVQGALMYDGNYLYISAVVADPFPMRSTIAPVAGRELYGGGGSVVLRLSTDRKLGWPVDASKPASGDLQPKDRNARLASLVMWYFRESSQPCLDVRYGMDLHGRRLNPPGYQGAWREHPDRLGYTLEYAIPWSLLNAADDPPRAGDTLACTWLVHWSDPEGQNWRGQLIEIVNPQAQGWNFENAATWGRARYEPPSQKKGAGISVVD